MTMNRTPARVVVLLLWLAPVPLLAQPEALPFDEALRQTMNRNPSLRAAQADREAAAAAVSGAKAGWWPRVSVRESWQRGDQPVFVFSSLLASRRFAADNFAIAALNQPDPIGYFHTLASVEQVVYDGGMTRASVGSATAGRTIADLGARELELQLARDTAAAYGRLLSLQALRRALDASLEAGREDLARATRRRDAGLATDADVLALAVHTADLEQRVIQADGDLAAQRAELNRLMGAPIDREYTAVEPPAVVVAPIRPLATLFAEADAARPEILRARAAEQLADHQRRGARAAFLPTVAAQAALDVSGVRLTNRASSWIVGGEMRWTLSTGGAERAQLQSATASRARARAQAEDARAAVQVEIVSAVRRLQAARARQTVGRAAVEQARESQRIVRDRYDAGLLPVNDVLRAAAAVLDADVQRVDAVVDAFTSAAALERAVGRLP
ncbi:MAG: TolC family protein [Vicinamibacterales bacterium]